MKRMILTLAVAAGVLCGLQRAQATILTPGLSGPPDIFVTLGSGKIVAAGSESVTSLDNPGDFTSTVNYAVYRTSAGTLDFLYQVANSGPNAIEQLQASSFTGYTTDVGYLSPTSPSSASAPITGNGTDGVTFTNGDLAPQTVSRQSSGSGVTFHFEGPVPGSLASGDTTDVLVIATNATSYGLNPQGITVSNDGSSKPNPGFAPSPEPASLALLGGCFAGLGLIGVCRRLRRKPTATTAV